jgi:hypothetical protein
MNDKLTNIDSLINSSNKNGQEELKLNDDVKAEKSIIFD